MKRNTLLLMALVLCLGIVIFNISIATALELNNGIVFVENRGQFSPDVKFAALTPQANIYFHGNEVTYVLSRKSNSSENSIESFAIQTRFLNGDPIAQVIGENELNFKHNYFIGNDRSKWQSDVSCYQSILYKDIYPGIDLRYIAGEKGLKYEFIVQSGADPSQIVIDYDGIDKLSISETGDLQISTRYGDLIEKAPYVYQHFNGKDTEVSSNYQLLDNSSFTITISENYAPAHQLVIDPYLEWSTYLGGINNDGGNDVVCDSEDNIYVIGVSSSPDYPLSNPYQDSLAGNDIVITKISNDGTSILYSTFLGGSDWDYGRVIKLDADDNIFFGAGTQSSDFPMVNAYDSVYNGGYHDVVIGKISADGTELLFSTYLGGEEEEYVTDIAVDIVGNVYLTGHTESENFPTVNAFSETYNGGNEDAFVAMLSSTGENLQYCSFIGGSHWDYGMAIETNEQGFVYVGGYTHSSNFPIYNAFDGNYNGENDAFIMLFSENFDSLLASTFIGGTSDDNLRELKIDSEDNVYIIGRTKSSDFPIVNAYNQSWNLWSSVYLTKWDASLEEIIFSTYFGGEYYSGAEGYDVAFDSFDNVYFTGMVRGVSFPTMNPIDRTFNGEDDVFVSAFNSDGDSLLFSTYLGGTDSEYWPDIAINSSDNIFITGMTRSDDFRMFNSSLDTTQDGNEDIFVVKIANDIGGTIKGVVTDANSMPIHNAYVNIENLSTNAPTNPDGEFTLPSLRAGSYDLLITHEEFLDTTYYNISASLDETTYVNIEMMTGGVITGIVTDSAANPFADVYVTAIGYPNNDSTDNGGRYWLSGFAAGFYDIRFRFTAGYPGFIDTTILQAQVNGHDTTYLDLSAIPHEPDINIWFGNIDDSPLTAPLGQPVEIKVYFQTNGEDVEGADIGLPLAINNCYIDSFITGSCQIHYPFTEWWSKSFGGLNDDFHLDSYDCTWDSYSFTAFCCGFWTPPLIHTDPGDPPIHGLTFTAAIRYDTLLQDSISTDALGPGFDYIFGPANIGDPEGGEGYTYNQYFSPLHFISFPYLPGDANMPNGLWPPDIIGADVTYLVNYFRAMSDPCMLEGFYAASDINGDCLVIGSDVTRLVNYFRGEADLSWCPDYSPAWPTPDDLPVEAPDGWPGCDE